MVAVLLGAVPFEDVNTVQMVAYSAHQAVIHGRDTLTVADVDLATEELASAASTTIAIFCYDDNGNGVSDGDAIALFTSLPFLQGVDIWVPADPTATTAITFNGRTLQVPQRGDGAVIAVLE